MFEPTFIIALAALTGLAIVCGAALRGWHGWLALKRQELENSSPSPRDTGSPIGAARIELADLKERIRKLEAIANGVDL